MMSICYQLAIVMGCQVEDLGTPTNVAHLWAAYVKMNTPSNTHTKPAMRPLGGR